MMVFGVIGDHRDAASGSDAGAPVELLKQGGRRYIVGTPKSMLKRYERELLAQDWRLVHEGLEVLVSGRRESVMLYER